MLYRRSNQPKQANTPKPEFKKKVRCFPFFPDFLIFTLRLYVRRLILSVDVAREREISGKGEGR